MKAKLTLIASALLLVSSIAGAQEQGAPSAKMTGEEAPRANIQAPEKHQTKIPNPDGFPTVSALELKRSRS